MTSPHAPGGTPSTEVFKALGDPIRWSIVQQMAAVDELPASELEHTLPVSKPTISYHTKILTQAGLISIRKQGRNFFYTLRREVLRSLVDELWEIAPEPRPVREVRVDHQAAQSRRRRAPAANRLRAAPSDDTPPREAQIVTW